MKVLVYKICTMVNIGTEADPIIKETFSDVHMTWNPINEETAKKEAYNGEYTIEDDGQPEPVTEESRITELEEALELLLSGVTE